MSGLHGQATDIDIHARDLMRLRERLNEILALHTGQPIDKINLDTERDFILEADEAKAYGLVDKIIVSRSRVLNQDPLWAPWVTIVVEGPACPSVTEMCSAAASAARASMRSES